MNPLYRCELAEALLYSPVAEHVVHEDRLMLLRLLSLTEAQALDPRRLTDTEYLRGWPLARCPAGLPAVVAARTWPCGAAEVDAAVETGLAQVHAAQLLTSAGVVELDRHNGRIAGWRPRPRSEGETVHPSRVRVRLSEVYTYERIRGLLLGPLAAWPVDHVGLLNRESPAASPADQRGSGPRAGCSSVCTHGLRTRSGPTAPTLSGMATPDRTQTPHSDPLRKQPAPPADGDVTDEQKRLADERRATNPGAGPAPAKSQPPTPDNPQRGIVGPEGADRASDPARRGQR